MTDAEFLSGGSTTVVVRVGDTVRRPAGPWTPAAHAVLKHLAAVGFTGAPRVLGFDDRSREVLEYVPGEAGTLDAGNPLPAWFRTPQACRSIGRWIRDFQTAQEGLVLDPALPWRRAAGSSLGPGQVVVHHDVSPYNTIRRPDGSLVVVDWDFARTGDPVEDLAWAAWRWVPLIAGTWWHAEFGVATGEDVAARQAGNLAALLDGYGPTADQRVALVDAVATQARAHAADLEQLAVTDPAFARLVDAGYAARARDDADWWVGSDLAATVRGD